ncbi:Alpha-2-macroglobulin [plant metagenome]|uniref:Alpha-2-macroglobulin n=1 Tax=plant metagenome TaxID=1297885 RepID=A0A484R0D7_9ZZZZ
MASKRFSWGLVAAVAVVCAGAGAVGWWAGKGRLGASPDAAPVVVNVSQHRPSPAAGSAPGSTIGDPDPFNAVTCQAREFNDSLALAVTFTQPVDGRRKLDGNLRVIDTGEAPSAAGRADEAKQGGAQPGTPFALSDAPARSGQPVQGSWTMGENPRVIYFPYVQPERRYEITLGRELAAQGGATLPEGLRCVVDTEAMPPSFYFASRGVVLPAGQNGGLPVTTVNQPEVDVQFLRVAPDKVPEFFSNVLGIGATRPDDDDGYDEEGGNWRYSSNRTLKGSVDQWDLDRLRNLTTSVYQGRFLTDDKPNRRHVTFLPVETIAPLKEPGIYVAVMSQPGRFRYDYQVTYFYVSDIGLHARRYAGQLEAFAVSLSSGAPLADVDVEVLDDNAKVLARARADAQGHATLTGDLSKARVLRALRGREMTVLALGEPALDLSEFDVGGHPARANSVFVYAGRNLYRPGERFHVSVLPRDPDGRALPAAPLSYSIKRPDGKVSQSGIWKGDEKVAGYVQQAIALPADAPTGGWTLELRVDPATRVPDASWKFQVEEFLPERMKLVLDGGQGVLSPGENWEVSVQGDYLYGAPADGMRLLSSLQVRCDRMALPAQWPGFIFGDVADDATRRYEELPEKETNAQGGASLDIDPSVEGARSPMRLRLSASLLESGGRPVVRSLERSVWPADKLIAVRPLFDRDVTRESSGAAFEAVRVDARGEIVPLAAAQMRLYHERRQYYWRYDDNRGWNSGYTDTDELVESRQLPLHIRMPFSLQVGWGRYRLEITDPETGQTLRYRFYAGWDAQNADEIGNRPDRVQMQLARVPAKPGVPVSLTFRPPHDGRALITVEGDTLLWSKWVDAKADGTRIDIPLNDEWRRHDLYVSATVFRPGSTGDRVTPARAVGLVHLPLDTTARGLKVALNAPAKVRPETQAMVQVQVEGEGAKTAHVTLSAVDVGILNINQYATPDPFDFFFGKHRYAPELLDMYGKLIEKMDGTRGRLKWGGDAALRGDTRSLPRKVKLVDLFSGVVALDEQGRAQIPLDLPDFNGTLRLMAVAFTDERYGHADAEMVVAAPIVAELSTPRFITPGDQAAVALDVSNMTEATQQVSVKLSAGNPLAIADGARTVTLKPRQRSTLRFTATTTGSLGAGKITLNLEARGGPEPVRITRESELTVQPAYAPRREVLRLRLAPGESRALPVAFGDDLHMDSATLAVTVSSRPPLNVAKLVKDLLDYPYGCTEQTVSAAMPYVVLDEEAARLAGLPAQTQEVRAARIEGALARLSGMRGGSGAYSTWGEGSQNLWTSAYVQSFLLDAREQGFTVPDSALARTRDWLMAQLRQAPNRFGTLPQSTQQALETGRYESRDLNLLRDSHQRFAELAAVSLVLAREGKAPLASLRVLYDDYQDRARSPLPLIQMAVAFKLTGDEGRARQAVDAAMQRAYGFGGTGYTWLGDYGSALRDYAMAYALMARHALEHPRRENLLAEAANRLGGRSYLSTQEQVSLLLAARAAGGGAGKPWSAELSVPGATPRTETGTDDRVLSVGAAVLESGLTLRNTGKEALFAEIDLQGYPMAPPAERHDPISLRKTWYHTDGRVWDGNALRTGDVMVVRLQATARQRIADGLVVDRVPAGLEVENINLVQGPQMQDWTLGGKRVQAALSDSRVKHTEYRDDRFVAAAELNSQALDIFYMVRVVSPGRYTVPAVEAEDMYRPELRGVGASWGTVEVRDRQPASKSGG